MGQLRVGSAKIDITPPVGSPFGCGGDEISHGVHDSLYVTSVVFDNGECEVVLVAIDLLGVDLDFTSKVAEKIFEAVGIPSDNVMIAASHTHTGPQGFPAKGLWFKQRVNAELRAEVAGRIVQCVAMAHKAKRNVQVGLGRGFCDKVGANRRIVGGPVDSEVQVMRIDDTDGNPYTIIFNYACHPTVAHSTGLVKKSLLISADYPGAARGFIEEALGSPIAVFTNGACGDISTRFTRKNHSFDEVNRLGHILGASVVDIAAGIDSFDSNVELRSLSTNVTLPTANPPRSRDIQKQINDLRAKIEALKSVNAPYPEIKKLNDALLGAQATLQFITDHPWPKKISTKLQVMKIGQAVLIAIPGELFSQLGKRIKREVKSQCTWVIGYANDYIGYLLTPKAFMEGGYEAIVTRFNSRTTMAFVDKSIELANELIGPSST